MAAASTITFVYDPGGANTTLTINGPTSTDVRCLARTVSDRTADHTRRSYQTTSTKLREWALHSLLLTSTQAQSLETFFYDTVNGTTRTFRFTHTDGTVYNSVRFAQDELQMRRLSSGQWETDLLLELATQVS